MPSVFSGIRKISDKSLILEIALLENVSVGNAVKDTGSKALGRLAAFAGSLGEKLGVKTGNDGADTTSARGTQDMLSNIDKRCVSLSGLSRNELELKFKNLLIEKCSEFMPAGSDSSDMAVSEDWLSVTVINEAAKVYETDRYLTPSLKADEIYKNYEEQILKTILKLIKSETGEAEKKREMSLQLALNEAPIEAKRNMQRRLVLEEFSGRGIYAVIKSSSGIKKLRVIVECIGYSAFDMTKVYIDTSFDMMFGVHRLKRALFAHIVWLAVGACGGKFAVNADILPSFVPADLRNSVETEEREYMKQIEARRELLSSYEKARVQMERYEKELADVMEVMTEEQDPVKVTQVKNNLDFAQKQYEEFKREYESLADLTARKTQSRARQLELSWKAFFPRYSFDEKVFEHAVERYTRAELLNVERMMKEMHDSIDIAAYSAKKQEFDGQLRDCALCLVSTGKNACIIYNGNKIFEV
ncbi:MAG: hypothetical protein ACI4EV_09360 [Lachnospiraceae bacterium]